MKCVIITDTHLGIKRSKKNFEKHILKYLKTVVDFCLANNIKIILHLGDFFDVRSSISFVTLKNVKEQFLNVLRDNEITLHIIPGNHDSTYKNSLDANSVSLLFTEYENINVYNKPTIVYFEDSTNLLMVPWITKEDEDDFIKQIDDASLKTDICCGHFEFRGFLYQKGIYSDDGMDAKIFSPKFKLVLSGHYHSKSQQDVIHYLGTGVDLTWADYGERKYFHVLDTQTNELDPIEYTDFIHRKIFYDETQIDQDALKELDEIDFEDKIINVVIKKRNNMILFDNFLEKLYNKNPDYIDIIDETIIRKNSNVSINPELLTKGTLEIINSLIDELDTAQESKSKIKTIMFNLYNEAQE